MPNIATQLLDMEYSIKKISQQLELLEKSAFAEQFDLLDKASYQVLNNAIESARAGAERVNEEIKILEQFTKMLH